MENDDTNMSVDLDHLSAYSEDHSADNYRGAINLEEDFTLDQEPGLLRRQSSRFSEIRRERNKIHRDLYLKVIRMQAKGLLWRGVLLYLSNYFGQQAYQPPVNLYTINHVEYNTTYLWLELRFYLLLAFGILSQRNMGIRIRVRCLDLVLSFAFILLRVYVLFICFFSCFPDLFWLIKRTFTILNDNWWHSDDEPFITNCSVFNAILCNVLWLQALGTIIIISIIIPALVAFIGFRIRRIGARRFCMGFTAGCTICFKYAWKGLLSYLLGTSLDIFYGWRENETDDEFKREKASAKFVENEKKVFDKMLFDEARDCPICLQEFDEEDEVIQLPCSQSHLYHAHCFESMLAHPMGKQKCPLCQTEFEI